MAPPMDDDAASAIPGASGSARMTVTQEDTAIAFGSGDLPVLATPRMIALMEEAACVAVAPYLPPGSTSVGISLEVQHTRATPVGASVVATATVTSTSSGRIVLTVEATADTGHGELAIGSGTHVRAVVDRAAFLARLDAQG